MGGVRGGDIGVAVRMIPPHIRAEIIAAVANGMSLREAEQKFAVAKTTISRLTKGVEPRKIFTAETKAAAIAAVEAGEPRNEIAKRLNCSTSSIEDWLRAVLPRDRTAERKEQKSRQSQEGKRSRKRAVPGAEIRSWHIIELQSCADRAMITQTKMTSEGPRK